MFILPVAEIALRVELTKQGRVSAGAVDRPIHVKPLDLLGKRFLLLCFGLFLLAFALRLNGSSSFIWRGLLHDDRIEGGLILGEPRPARSDEWLVWTPALLSQCEHGFPAENPSLGAGKAPFLYSLPVKHYTMWFRPQLYGFFFLPTEWGYAWFWNLKVFGLLAVMFLLFWTLTKQSTLSIFGTLWIFFSNYVQWWFSCPPMLPEMLISWAGALICAITLLETRSWRMRAFLAATFVLCSVNFALCLYPPFQIPLLYLGLALFGASVWSQRARAGQAANWQGALSLIFAFACVLAVLIPFFFELRPTLELLSRTTYPGHRRSHGGDLGYLQYFSGLMNLLDEPSVLPGTFAKANETANFFPLWIPVLAVTGGALLARPREHASKIAALFVLMALSVYALCPLPSWISQPTLLSFCTEIRALLTIGLANIFFVVLSFPLFQSCLAKWNRKMIFGTIGLLSGLVGLYLYCASSAYPVFLKPARIGLFLLLDVALLSLLLRARARLFGGALIVLLVSTNGLVNPIMVGLAPILRASPTASLRQLIQEHPDDAWAAYESNQLSEYLMALGARVVSGLRMVPDLDFYGIMDPEREALSIYNRYSFAFFLFRGDRQTAALRPFDFPSHLVSIHPLNEMMKLRRVRFFVFAEPLSQPAKEGIELRVSFPDNHIWVYQPETVSVPK